MVGVDNGHNFAGVAAFDQSGGKADTGCGVAHCWLDNEVFDGDLWAKFANEIVMVLVDGDVDVLRFEKVETGDGFFEHRFG